MRPFAVLLLLGALAPGEVQDRLTALQTADEAALLKALEDEDWEVVHRAAEALGERGSAKAVPALVDLSLGAPIRRIRIAAATSLRRLAPEEAAHEIERRLKGDDLSIAADALAVLGTTTAIKALERNLRHKEAARRLPAIRVLASLGDPKRIEDFAESLRDEDVRVRAAAIAGLVRTGDIAAAAVLRETLKDPAQPRVVERRLVEGIRQVLLAQADPKKREFAAMLCVNSFGTAPTPETNARFARLFASLGRRDAPVGPVAEYEKALAANGLGNSAVEVRSASVAALAAIGATGACERIESLARSDSSARVRFHALRAADALRGAEAKDLFLDRVAKDADQGVREEAAVLLGRHRTGVEALIAALDDEAWEVSVSAAVSLGRTRHQRGVAPLQELARHKEWKRRGGAAAGLGWIQSKDAIDTLIDLLRDKETPVVATALEFLRHLSGKALPGKQKEWRDWWSEKRETFTFRDAEEAARVAKKYGYAVTPDPRDVYKDLDIVVLLTRRGGDHIEDLLSQYGIQHRGVRSASIVKAGLHPHAIFVSNCPGDLVDSDVDQLQWFVRAGGYLFSSCWAVTHTVKLCFPDVVQKVDLKGQVIDVVEAEPRPTASPFLHTVFDGVSRPFYTLEGAHLIDVLDAERFEVLVDSPDCASRYGQGDLAGWFSVGHGVVFDSVNHFDLQGMEKFPLKTETERMAFCLDHLGYDYAPVRELQAQGIFRKQPTAAKGTRDQTIFRMITNFVRQKREADQQ